MKKTVISLATLLALGLTFTGCGSSSTTTTTTTTTSGTLVDPYIVSATLCQDTDASGTCDLGEPVSTSTDASGGFTFSEALTPGKNIIIKVQGTHDGIPFDLNISGVVATDGSIDVVSPLTTFESKSLSAGQLVGILTQAANDASVSASYSFSDTTIFNDPLSGGLMDKTVDQITDADLTNIRAAIASYGLLKIMEGSTVLKALTGTELYTSGVTTGQPINVIAQGMLQALANSLNVTLLNNIITSIDAGRNGLISAFTPSVGATTATTVAQTALPSVKVGLIVKVAVKLITDIAQTGYVACNANTGDVASKVTAGMAAATTRANLILNQTKIMSLGTTLYFFENKDIVNATLSGAYAAGLTSMKQDADIARGLDATSNVTTFNFNANGDVTEYTSN